MERLNHMGDEFEKFMGRWAWYVLTALVGSSMAGIAALLRDGKPVSTALILRAAFISLVVGGIFLAALWDSLAASRPAWLLAVVLCAGAGGGNLLDAVAGILKRAVERFGKGKE